MTELKSALERLAHAVTRLEHAAGDSGRREASLADEVVRAHAARSRADADAAEMSRRLEAAINRLEAVLEG